MGFLKGDLHCHTRYSDGSATLETAAVTAQRSGLDCLAVTDHDTIETFDEIDRLQPGLSVKLIKGTELSAYDFKRKRKVHILCLMPIDAAELKKHCEAICKTRRECACKMAAMAAELYPIEIKDVLACAEGSTSVFKQHIMHALADRGFTTSIFGDLFGELFDPENGKCYLSCPAPDVYETLKLARNSGAVVVFAHPGVYNSYELLDEVCEKGLVDAIEVSHSRNRPGDFERLTKTADAYGLIKTGGSDFHGFYSSRPVQIGSCVTDSDNLESLFALHEKNKTAGM